ncbi:hypothetical protein [uncultured Brachybacterium sp.]|uniref:hypothetical protein n=1 Tax=uncultured Brachybacterium sp. TaxID=189680 RepID=UPI002620B20E|nr:hypothetical protein [uncultured Brachybacterium sp.]
MSYHPQGPLPDRSKLQSSAIILIVVGFLCGGTIPAIFGIIALVQMDSDPYSAQKMNKIGWILFWVMLALIVLFIIVYVVFMVLIFGVATLPFLMGG